MTNNPSPALGSAAETHELYVHLLNLKGEDGKPATDAARLYRAIAESPGVQASHLDPAVLSKYLSGDQEIGSAHLEALRVAVDRAHREAVDPKFTWKPRWLNAPQGQRHAHPSIPNHSRR